MKHATILIADDEVEIADLVALHMEKEGHKIIKVHDGEAAVHAIQKHTPDLAILDIMMPKMDGYEVTRQIREQQHTLPIIFLSAKASDFDKITGLVIGSDDYMTKPFNPMELVARVQAQLRRTMQFNQVSSKHSSPLEAGGLSIDPEQRQAMLYGETVALTPKEFDILFLLASHPKKVFRAENIFQRVWGEAYFEGQNTVMVHIRTLRKKLGDQDHTLIKTVWGVGYTFYG